jgi:alkylation response protein AidB-like acyl-CoA dehydrogenase
VTAVDHELRGDLRETARSLLSRQGSPAQMREIVERGDRPAALDATIAELGWGAVEIPEAFGGLGAGFGELLVLLHELGRVVAPASFVSTAVLGVPALRTAGAAPRERWLPRIAEGDAIVTAALTGASGDPGAIDLVAVPDGDGWRLDGVGGFVPELEAADAVVVAARETDGDGVTLFLVEATADGLDRANVPMVDATRRFGQLTATAVRLGSEQLIGAPGAGRDVREQLLRRAAVATAADSVGGAEWVLEATVEYLKTRVQFGRPIGSFQALKHRCADMLFALEASRGAVDHAAARIDDPDQTPASIAKSYAGDAYVKIAQEGVQMHGGIGYTWEHDLHLYLKRARLNQLLFGDSPFHRAVLAQAALTRS